MFSEIPGAGDTGAHPKYLKIAWNEYQFKCFNFLSHCTVKCQYIKSEQYSIILYQKSSGSFTDEKKKVCTTI